ncbi:hypothetical protein [Nocardioides sp. MH1]|uniref:hypothetical protein n=1 Tax=Nocardioides sp. MH1 TaxID=3242490 RepID=UPI003521099B
MDVLEAVLSPLAVLVYPFLFPMPGLLVLGGLAWRMLRWSRRRRIEKLPPPMFTQPWAWIGWSLVGVYTFLIGGLAVLAWQPALLLLAVLVVPLGTMTYALVRAHAASEAPERLTIP